MNVAQRLISARPSVTWRLGQATTSVLYRRGFAHIGQRSVICKPRALRGVDRIRIGDDVSVYSGAWLACEGAGQIVVGDGTYLGHDVHLHAMDDLTIGRNCMLVDGVYIGTADHDRANRETVTSSGPVTLGDNVFVGQRAIILGGVSVGDGATIGGGAVVTKDVPAGATVAGVPARRVGSEA